MGFPALYPPWFGGSTFLLSKPWASFLATIHPISFPVLFCIVRIRYPFSFMVLSRFWNWLKVTMWPIFGNLSCCEAFFVQTKRSLLIGSWCLSIWPCQDQELYPCSVLKVFQWIPAVIRWSFEPTSVGVLSSPFQTSFLSSGLFWLLCWTKSWSSAEPFSLLVFGTSLLASMRLGVLVFAAQLSICS